MRKTSPRAVTLQDIADAGGVTRMTVSRVLRNHPGVAPETRERILALAAKSGYRPNPLVSTLMSGIRSGKKSWSPQTIAFLSAFDTRLGWQDFPTIRRFYSGARVRADQLGYSLEHFWVRDPDISEKRLSDILYNRGIQGLILAPAPRAGETLGFDWNKFSAASLEFAFATPRIHRSSNNQFETMNLALANIRSAGRKRIGLTMGRHDDERVNHHYAGAFWVDQNLHSPRKKIPPLECSPADFSAFEKWYFAHRPDAIISTASVILDWLRKMRIRVPSETAFVHANLQPENPGRVAGVDQRSELVGEAAVDIVVGQFNRNERGIPAAPRLILVEGEWVEGHTLASTRQCYE